MPITSGQINQSFAAQQSMFGGQMAYAQQLSYPMQSALQPGMQPPPPPSAVGGFLNAQPGQAGMVGEQFAAQGVSGGLMAGGMAMSGLQLYGMMGGGGMMGSAGRALDPFSYMSAGFRGGSSLGGRMGMGMVGRGAMGALGAGAAALPIYGAYKAASLHMNAFQGGMEDQVALNSTLRGNFQHFGGQGAYGRGFSQRQMGQIGMDTSSVVKNDPFMSMGEATSLIGQGAQGGMFTGVREVSEFNQKFRQMLDTLKGVQKELGGSLTDAMKFVQEAKQSGVFQQSDRLRLATGQRTVAATTGLNSMQQAQMTQFGAQLSRAVGGRAAQGAFGAQRTMQQVGAMVQSGALNEEQIYEITGQSGAEGQMAFAQNMMQKVARFSKRPAGRYSIFGLAGDESGQNLDPAQLQRFLAGDMGVGELSQRAHRNVGRMGRARAINQEGRLRGSLLEQGGMAGQIGIMRMMVGDRVLDQDDDKASLVLQRRFGMGREESEAMMSMMRNQGAIAQQESLGRVGAARETSQRREVEERSVDAIMDRLGNSMSNNLGLNDTREAGQRLVTKMSSLIENVMNDMLGVVSNEMSSGARRAVDMASIGQASGGQMRRIQQLAAASEGMGRGRDPFARGAQLPVWLGGRKTRGQSLRDFGIDARGLSGAEVEQQSIRASMAMQGHVTGDAAEEMARMAADPSTVRSLTEGSFLASGQRQIGGLEGTTLFDMMGTDFAGTGGGAERRRLAATAFMSAQGMNLEAEGLGDPSGIQSMSEGLFSAGTRRSFRDVGSMFAGFGGNIGGAGRALLAAGQEPRGPASRYEKALSYVSRGGVTRNQGAAHQRRARRERYESIGREGIEAVMQDPQISDLMGRITAASSQGDTSGVQSNLEALRQHGLTLEGTDNRAVQGLYLQMKESADRNNGRVGREFLEIQFTPEEREAFIEETKAKGSFFQRLGMETGNEAFSDIGQSFMRGEAGAYNSVQDMVTSYATGSEEDASRMMEQLGTADLATDEQKAQRDALVQSMSRERALINDMTGRGRRGQTQAFETALGGITGHTFGGMEFEVGGRSLRGDRARRVLQRVLSGQGNYSDEQREEIRGQLASQMRQKGIEGADDLIENLQTALTESEDGESVGELSQSEAVRMSGKMREHGQDNDKARRGAMAEAQAQAAARDPMGAERNKLLERILQSIQSQGKDGNDVTEGDDGRGKDV